MNAVAKIIQAAREVDAAGPSLADTSVALANLKAALREGDELEETIEVLAADAEGVFHKLEVGTPLQGDAVVVRVFDDEGSTFVQTDGDQYSCRPRDYRAEGPSGPYVMVCDDVRVSS